NNNSRTLYMFCCQQKILLREQNIDCSSKIIKFNISSTAFNLCDNPCVDMCNVLSSESNKLFALHENRTYTYVYEITTGDYCGCYLNDRHNISSNNNPISVISPYEDKIYTSLNNSLNSLTSINVYDIFRGTN